MSVSQPYVCLSPFALGVPLPLHRKQAIDLQSILNGVYERAGYRFRIDYRQPVPPPVLPQADREWVYHIAILFVRIRNVLNIDSDLIKVQLTRTKIS